MAAASMTLSPRARLPRGWLRWALTLAAVITAWVWLANYASRPDGPEVSALVIQVPPGQNRVSAGQIRTAVASVARGGEFTVNITAVRNAVQALAWVRSAQVTRVWPDALGVSVRLRKPVARWGHSALVDTRGVVFAPSHLSAFAALPALDGPADQASEVLADFARVRAAVHPLGLVPTGLTDNARGELSVTFASGLTLVLGRKQPFGRLQRFIQVAVPALGPKLDRAATVDMRYPNGFAVGWKGEGDHGRKE